MLSMEKFTVTGGGTKVSLGSLVTNCSGAFSQGPPNQRKVEAEVQVWKPTF